MNYINKETPNGSGENYRFCDYSNERSILAKAIQSEDHFYTLLTKVSEDDFLSDDTKSIFFLLKTLHDTGIRSFDTPILVTAAKELGKSTNFTKDYVEALKNVEVSDLNFDLYVDKLLDDSTKFKLYNDLLNNTNMVFENASTLSSTPSSDLLSKVQADLLSLSSASLSIEEPKHVADGLDEYLESIQDKKVELMGLSTGYPVLDKAIDGLVPGTLTIVAARKKMGKSTLLTNIASYVSVHQGDPILYIDTEMTFKEWRDRVIAIISGVDERVIKHGGFKKDKTIYERIINAVTLLKNSKLFHFYMPGFTVEKISALFKKYHLKENIVLGVFDYIKEPDSASTEKGRKEHQILGDVTTKLKDLAGMLNIPFLAAVQLNRSGDVADSDRIARYGDVIAFWGLRDKKKAEEEAWDLEECGFYGLSIKDSRRGGRTGEAGIGYHFFHSKLIIKEVDVTKQVENSRDENERIDTGIIEKVGGIDDPADQLI